MQMRSVGFCDCDTDYRSKISNEANFAVFCQHFAQIFFDKPENFKIPWNSRPGIKTVPISGNSRRGIPDGLEVERYFIVVDFRYIPIINLRV